MRKITTLFILMILLIIAFPPDLFAPPLFRGRTEKQMAARIGSFPAAYYTGSSVTDGIQEANDAAFAAGGGTVWLSAEAYTLETNLDLDSNVSLQGTGMGTIVQSDTSTDRLVVVSTITGTPDLLESVAVGVNVLTCSTAANASDYTGGDVVYLDDSSVDTEPYTFYVVSSGNGSSGSIVLESNTIYAYPGTPRIKERSRGDSETNDVSIKDIYFKNVKLFLDQTTNVNIEGCRFEDADDETIKMLNSNKITITNNHISNSTSEAIEILRSGDVSVVNNKIDKNTNIAIDVTGSSKCVLSGNTITGNDSGYGIRINDSIFNVLSDNLIDSTADDEIYLSATADSNTVAGNIIPYGVIDNDGAGNRGSGNIYSTCEGCDEPSSW
jgi:parallel beta-helix repeat protein